MLGIFRINVPSPKAVLLGAISIIGAGAIANMDPSLQPADARSVTRVRSVSGIHRTPGTPLPFPP